MIGVGGAMAGIGVGLSALGSKWSRRRAVNRGGH